MAAPNNGNNVGRSIYLDTTSAQTAAKKMNEELRILEATIKKGEAAGKNMSAEIAKLSELKGKIQIVQDVLDKGLAPSLREQEKLVKRLRLEMRGMSTDAEGFDKKRKAYLSASADLDKMRANLGGVTAANNQLGGSLLNMAKNAAGVALAAIGISTAFAFLEGTVQEANDAEAAVSRLRNTLENVGRSDAMERIITKGVELQQQFKFIDNDDITGVFQKLITYGKLTERQINDLLPVIINFAAKNRISVDESASVIIKALEGSSKGLKEYGINMKNGADVTERFGIIMGDLKPRVDGAADAFGETFAGKMAIARQEIKDTQEEIGNKLIPILAKLLKFTSGAFSGLSGTITFIKNSFAMGSLSGGKAITDAQLRAEAAREAEAKAVDNIINSYKTDAKGRARSAKEVIDQITAALNFDTAQLALKQVSGDVKGQMLYESSIATTKKALEKIKATLNPELDKVLGLGGKDKEDPDKSKELDAMRQHFKDLITQLNQTAQLLNLSPIESEFLKINDLLEKQIADIEKLQQKGAISAKDAAEAIKLAQLAAKASSDAAFNKDRDAVDKKRQQLGGTTSRQENAKYFQERQPALVAAPSGGFNFSEYLQRDKAAALQVQLLQAKSAKERRDAQINLLQEEYKRELDNSKLTGEEKIKIDIEFAAKRKQIEQSYQQEIAQMITNTLNLASDALNILSAFAQARNNIEQQAFNKEKAINDQKKRDLELNSKKGLVTEQSYRVQILKMDQELDAKKRKMEAEQFERNRKIQIAQALINGALGITQAWVKPGWPLALVYTALIAANTAAQIGVINSQKPQFSKGGIPDGPAHGSRYGQSGIALVRRDNGQEVGEMEGGEPYMILSKKFRQNNPGLIPKLLDASRTGARMIPYFMLRQYQAINYPALTMTKRSFADGGVVSNTSNNQLPISSTINSERMEMLLEALIVKLDQPSIAIISQDKIEKASYIKSSILSEAEFR